MSRAETEGRKRATSASRCKDRIGRRQDARRHTYISRTRHQGSQVMSKWRCEQLPFTSYWQSGLHYGVWSTTVEYNYHIVCMCAQLRNFSIVSLTSIILSMFFWKTDFSELTLHCSIDIPLRYKFKNTGSILIVLGRHLFLSCTISLFEHSNSTCTSSPIRLL